MQNEPFEIPPQERLYQDFMKAGAAAGIPPLLVADRVFEAMREERFYILTHPDATPLVQLRMENLLSGQNPQDHGELAMKFRKLNG